MKKLHSHKNPILLGGGILIAISIILLFTTCDIGLGQIVNTEKPVISNGEDGNGPGSFLQGTDNTIELNVENKLGFKIDEVFMDVEYIDKNTNERKTKKFPGYINPETGKWEVKLDTSEMSDGQIKAWVTAIDESGNETKSTEITYFVKNKLPQIEMTIPVINTEQFDDDEFLKSLVGTDPVYRRFSLMGVATDDFGIWPGFPKIMIWPSDNSNVDTDGLPRYDEETELPIDHYGYWYSMEDIPDIKENRSTTSTRFAWPMLNLRKDPSEETANSTYPKGGEYRLPKKNTTENREDYLPIGKYRFRVWTKDRFGNDNYYPNRTDHGDKSSSKKYIEISYKSATSTAMADITDCPEFYNLATNLKIDIILDKGDGSLTLGDKPVRAKIISANNNDAPVIWEDYAIAVTDTRFKLDIPPSEAQTWKSQLPEDNRLYVKAWAVTDQGEVAGPLLGTFFLVDYTPPDLTIDRPTALVTPFPSGSGEFSDGGSYNILYPTEPRPKWVTGIVTLGGVPKDPGKNASAVKKIYYHFGKLNDDKSITDAARKAIYDAASWKDTGLDTSTPVKDDDIHGKWDGTQYSFTWTYNIFPNDFAAKNASIVQMANDLGYNASSPEWRYKRTDSADGTTRVRFYLPFYIKVVDNADNYRIVHYTLCVDPLMDEPQIEITQPEIKEEGKKPIVGGTVRVAGTAEDNNWMHTVLMRVKKQGGIYPSGTKTDNGYYIPPDDKYTKFYTSDHSTYPRPKKADNTDDTDGWFKADIIGDSLMVNWYANINGDNALNPTGATVEVTIEVVAIDCDEGDLNHLTPHITGPVSTLVVDFSKDVPMFGNVKIKKENVDDRDYKDGIKTTGKFTFSMEVEAVGDINELSVRVNNTTTPVTLVKDNNTVPGVNAAWNVSGTTSPNAGKRKRTLTVTVNSTSTPMIGGFTGIPALNAIDYGKTGNMTLEVTATDNSLNKLTTNFTYNISIDNLYPTAVIQTQHIAFEKASAEKYYFVMGTAKDYNTGSESVQGLERVLVYFEKATITRSGGNRTVAGNQTYVRPDGSNAVTSGASSEFTTYPDVLDHGGSTTTSITAPNTGSYTRYPKLTYEKTISGPPETWAYKSKAALVIDYGESGVFSADNDQDGTKGEIWNGTTSSREWGARVDFSGSNWTDGPYIVHYLVMDEAGNAAHYQNDIYLQNNKPKISAINFGTDINGAEDVTDGTGGKLNEYLYASNIAVDTSNASAVAGVMSPSFRIRGGKFSVKLDYAGGNGNRTVKIAYVAAGAVTSVKNMTRGNVYEIVDFGSKTTDFTRYGAPNNLPGTVFVATGPVPLAVSTDADTTIGTVIPYTSPAAANGGNPVRTLASAPSSATVLFSTFPTSGTNAQKWESDKNTVGDIVDPNKNKRFFVIKVYDTTVTGGSTDAELDQLSDALLVKLDIDNVDNKKPTLNLLPFGQEYYVNPSATPPYNNPAYDGAKNAVNLSAADYVKNIGTKIVTEDDGTETVVKEGYVQYLKDNLGGAANTYISGKVKFIGKVEDNQRIGGIWVSITGYRGAGTTDAEGTKFQIARPIASGNNINLLEPMPPDANHAGHWAFRILDDNYLTLDYGHALTWEFMWDSSKVTNIARDNVTIQFEVRDASSAQNASDPKQVTTNIVPYISEVVTPLSDAFTSTPSVFNRSALGGYPVREGDTITIKGFNLGTGTGNNATSSVTIGGGNLTVTSRDSNTITGTVSTALSSGPLVVRVNNFDSFNNNTTVKSKTAAYNKEPNSVNNNILDNSRYVYVWTTGDLFNGSNQYYTTTSNGGGRTVNMSSISSPFMRVDNQGHRLIAHSFYNDQYSGRLRVLRDNTIIDLGTGYTNRIYYPTVGTGGSNSFYAAGTDSSSLDTENRGFQLGFSNNQGNNSINRSNNTGTSTIVDYANSTASRGPSHGNIRLFNTYDTATDRFKIPRIAVNSSSTTDRTTDNVLLCYYDSTNNRIEVLYATVGNNTVSSPNSTGTPATFATNSAVQVTSGGTIYTAAGLLKNSNNPIPVVAWYNNGNLYLSYGSAGSTTGLNANSAVIDTGKGMHVDMAVDANDNVHLAYYSNSGGLWYTFIPAAQVTNKNRTVTPVRVDTYLSAGTRLMINTRNNIPYISYAHASFPGTKQTVRVAWRLPTSAATDPGSFTNNSLTGKWEVMTVPVNNIPDNDNFICNGVPTGGTWVTPLGTSLTYNTGNLSQTIVVSYMTSTSYEGAIFKGNVTTVPSELTK